VISLARNGSGTVDFIHVCNIYYILKLNMALPSEGCNVKLSVRPRQRETTSGVQKVLRLQPLTAEGITLKSRRRRTTSSQPLNRKTQKSVKSHEGGFRSAPSRRRTNPCGDSSSVNASLSCCIDLEKTITNKRFLSDILDADDPLLASTNAGAIDVSGKSLTILHKTILTSKC